MQIDDIENDYNTIYVGLACDLSLDTETIKENVMEALDDIQEEYVDSGEFEDIVIMVYNTGILNIVDLMEYKTFAVIVAGIGVDDFEFDVDEIVYTTEEEKIADFIDAIDVLVKIGDGPDETSALALAEEEDISILEYDI